MRETDLERMNIVITGHVDHGKSTLVGRLLADTQSLPEGKLQAMQDMCKKNGRVFEYAFLLDALEDEQKQGITIDSARIFFKSLRREYIIIDAPGHIEFLRNMLSGASRADGAILVIDALEGVAENSRRHGLLLSLLGISQVVVAVNKLDALHYDEKAFTAICEEYGAYLETLKVRPMSFVPISAREGKNITIRAQEMPWYTGGTILEALDRFYKPSEDKWAFFAMPVQDVYRFSDDNDQRRIYAGTVVSGEIREGDAVLFLPSEKTSRIKTIEAWNAPPKSVARTHDAVGFTLADDIYVRPGEVMLRRSQDAPLRVSVRIKANLIWLGERPLTEDRSYLFKLGSAKVEARLECIERFLGDRTEDGPYKELRRHDCGQVVLHLSRPIALTSFYDNQTLGRFVMVDAYNAAGCGIILDIQDAPVALGASGKHHFEEELFDLLHRHFPDRF
ncbi:MAG: GTP-binding protein [Spirochaetaceae bacterium]|jgi:bifunctional enzyme CysN/CysC/sulfate adenylyltransferase subunit 1|nr:GTP-binding protein [Spirochaetaceae bacterium]